MSKAPKIVIPNPGDPDFASVVLLLDFAGADGATDITDLSNSAHVETFNGDTEVDTAIQIAGENTLLFPDTTHHSVSYADSADWDFGTGDFTIECFFELRDFGTHYTQIGTWQSGGSPIGYFIRVIQDGELYVVNNNGVEHFAASFTFVVNTAYHIAVSRSGTDLRFFIDGVQPVSSVTASDAWDSSGDPLTLGALRVSGGGNQSMPGSIGAVRITKGVGRYTENFTSPTEFYPTPEITDSDFSSVVLLLDFAAPDGAQDISDLSDSKNNDEAFNEVGTLEVDTAQTYLGRNSLLLNPTVGPVTSGGSNNRVEYTNRTDWDFGTGDFTVELGVRFVDNGLRQNFIASYNVASTDGWALQWFTGDLLVWSFGASNVITASWAPSTDVWYHLAMSKVSDELRMFIDGVQVGSTFDDTGDYTQTAPLALGVLTNNSNANFFPVDGYIGGVRITKGVGRYAANFTAPTEFYPTS